MRLRLPRLFMVGAGFLALAGPLSAAAAKEPMTAAGLAQACRDKTVLCSATLESFLFGFQSGASIWGEFRRLPDLAAEMFRNRCYMLASTGRYDHLADEFVRYVEQSMKSDLDNAGYQMTLINFAMGHCRDQQPQ